MYLLCCVSDKSGILFCPLKGKKDIADSATCKGTPSIITHKGVSILHLPDSELISMSYFRIMIEICDEVPVSVVSLQGLI